MGPKRNGPQMGPNALTYCAWDMAHSAPRAWPNLDQGHAQPGPGICPSWPWGMPNLGLGQGSGPYIWALGRSGPMEAEGRLDGGLEAEPPGILLQGEILKNSFCGQ